MKMRNNNQCSDCQVSVQNSERQPDLHMCV